MKRNLIAHSIYETDAGRISGEPLAASNRGIIKAIYGGSAEMSCLLRVKRPSCTGGCQEKNRPTMQRVGPSRTSHFRTIYT